MNTCDCLIQASTNSATGCVCAQAGYCERHQCEKTAHFVHLCSTNKGYFDMYEQGRGPCLRTTKSRRGLGDVIAGILAWFGIKPREGCGCNSRKAWLNSLWSWDA